MPSGNNTDITTTDENKKMCRFCSKLTESDRCVLLNDINESMLLQMLEVFIPELKLNIAKESAACEKCLDSVQNYFSFIMKCLDVEDKINSYIESKEMIAADQVVLNSVLQFIWCPILAKMKNVQELPIAENDSWLRSFEVNEDKSLENKSYTSQNSKIKEEYFTETQGPEIDFQVEKVFVIGENVVVKAEAEPERLNEEDIFEINDESSTDPRQVVSEINDNAVTVPEVDYKHFVELEHSDIESEQGVEDELEQNDWRSFQEDRKSRFKITQTRPHAKLGRFSDIIIYKRIANAAVGMYNCKICEYETKYKHVAIRHSLIHKKPSEITMYKCEICAYETKYKTYLKHHMLIHKNPSEIVMYKCDICSHETKRKELLTRHMLSHRDPEQITMYKCDLCDFKGKQKSYLKRHSLVHINSESQIYKCARCSFGTKHKQGLRRHIMNTHKDTSEILFKCEICPYSTKYKNQCNKHLTMHKNTVEVTTHM